MRIKGRTLPGVCVCVVYLLIIRNRHVDEMNSIQYNRIDTQCGWRRRELSVFFSFSLSLSLALYRSRSRSPSLFFSTDGSTKERRNFSFWKRKRNISIGFVYYPSFNSSTWFTVCYSKGVSIVLDCSLSSLFQIAAVGSGICKQTTAFVRSRFFGSRTSKRERREREEFSLSSLLRQYAAIRCNGYFDWRIRSPIRTNHCYWRERKKNSLAYFIVCCCYNLMRSHSASIVEIRELQTKNWKQKKKKRIINHLFVCLANALKYSAKKIPKKT